MIRGIELALAPDENATKEEGGVLVTDLCRKLEATAPAADNDGKRQFAT